LTPLIPQDILKTTPRYPQGIPKASSLWQRDSLKAIRNLGLKIKGAELQKKIIGLEKVLTALMIYGQAG
jgi:hypothetical protein